MHAKMLLLLAVSTVILQFTLALRDEERCHGKYECPDYKVIEKNDDYEVREYPTTNFAQASVSGSGWRPSSTCFMRLFRYIGGKNEQKQKIPMTVPVLTPRVKGNDDYVMQFWLPKEFQKNPPKPIKSDNPDNDVTIVNVETRTVYVRTFGWWTWDFLVNSNTEKLKASLVKNDIDDFDEDEVIVATYNEPWKMTDRTNEVMLVKKTKK